MHSHREPTALIVDDDTISSFITRHILESRHFSHHIDVCHSAKEAAHFLDELYEKHIHAPDYIFLDVHMPGKTGLEFLDEMPDCHREMLKASKVVLLTAHEFPIPDKYRRSVHSISEKPLTDDKLRSIFV